MTDYYVRNGGNDSLSGLDGTTNAWETLGRVVAETSSMVGGDTVYINGGDTFDGVGFDLWQEKWEGNLLNITSYGTGKPTLLAPLPGDKGLKFAGSSTGTLKYGANVSNIRFDSGNPDGGYCVQFISGVKDGVIDNCDFVYGAFGVYCAQSNNYAPENITISNCTFSHIGAAGYLGTSNTLNIIDNVFYNCGFNRAVKDHSIYVSGSKPSNANYQIADNQYIARNKFYNNCHDNGGNNSSTVVAHGTLATFLIEDNEFYEVEGTPWGSGYGIDISPGYNEPYEYCHGLIIRRNYIECPGAIGVRVQSASDIEMYNNVVYRSGEQSGGSNEKGLYVEWMWSGTADESVNANIHNNLVYDTNDQADNIEAATIADEVLGVKVNENNPLIRYDKPLRALVTKTPTNGYISTLDEAGAFTYVNQSGAPDTDQFSYKIVDALVGSESNVANVVLTVEV